ncbi:MAG: phage tail protein [Opitutales bacterium]|nr:phage tail protein [Opitutales bacterium]
MAAPTMMTLGEYAFAMDTAAYEALARRTVWRWPEQGRAGRAPALQFTGPGEDTLTLEGTLYPAFRGGLGQLDAMRAEAGRGLPLLLMGGDGRVLGRWAVESVEERQRVFLPGGAPKRVDFTLSLRFYGDDADA